jgi:hypothetical protein
MIRALNGGLKIPTEILIQPLKQKGAVKRVAKSKRTSKMPSPKRVSLKGAA